MSAIITGKVFWTPFKELSYQDKAGKTIKIKETTAKIVMLAIADSADDYGENSWQSFETIAQKASIERRSVIRVVRALLEHKYLTIAGITQYGTNNFGVNKDLLGCPPAKRAKNGRPKTSDSEAFTSDPETQTSDSQVKTGDPQSPDPSLIPPPSSLKRGDLVDGYLELLNSPGIKRAARIDTILSYLGGKLKINTETKRWKDFAKFADDRQQVHHEPLDIFVSWLISQKNFDIQFWPPSKMQEMWPRAFLLEAQPNTPQINEVAVERTRQYNEQRWDFKPAPPPVNISKPVLKQPERRPRR